MFSIEYYNIKIHQRKENIIFAFLLIKITDIFMFY